MIGVALALGGGCDDSPTRPGEGFYWYAGFRDWWRIPLIYPYQISIKDSFASGSLEKYDPSSPVAEGKGEVLIPAISAFAETGKYWLFKTPVSFFAFDIVSGEIRHFDSEKALLNFLEAQKFSLPEWQDLSALYKERWAFVDQVAKRLERKFLTQRKNYYGRRIPLKMPWQLIIADRQAFIGKYETSQAISDLLPPQENSKWVENIVAANYAKNLVVFQQINATKPYGCLIYATGSVRTFATPKELADFIELNYPGTILPELLPLDEFYDLMWQALDNILHDPKKAEL